jgi:dihydrofolate reductase
MDFTYSKYMHNEIIFDENKFLILEADSPGRYEAMRKLWCSVFGDEPEFVDSMFRCFADEIKGYIVVEKEQFDRCNNIEIDNAIVAHSVEEAAQIAAQYDKAYVIGGASIYKKMLPYCDKVHATVLDCAPKSDVFFPNLDVDPAWECTDPGDWQEENGIRYRFATYERK